MLLLFLSFIIQVALATGQMGPLKDFEEGVLSNNMTPKPADDMDHPLAEPAQGMAAIASQSENPPKLASLEAAVLTKYHVNNLADLEAAVIANYEVEAPSAESQKGSGLKLRKAHHKHHTVEAHSPESQKAPGLKLRRAHHKHHTVEAPSPESQKGSGLKIRKAHHKVKTHSSESQQGSGLKVRKAHHKDAVHAPESQKASGLKLRKAHHKHHKVSAHSTESQKASGLKIRRAHHKQHTAESHFPESQQGSGLKVRKRNARDGAETPSVASQKARFKFKKMTPLDEAPKEVIGTFGQITHEAPSPAQEVEGEKVKKNVIMHDTPHHRSQGAATLHVEPTPRKSMTPEQVSLAWEDTVAMKSNKPTSFRSAQAVADGVFMMKLTRCIFLLAGLCIIAGIAYHKYEMIAQLHEGNMEPQKFKAKQEDKYGLASAPCFSPQVTTACHMSAVVGSFRQGLVRRGAKDTTSFDEFGV